jgi:hypothetical protein
MKLDFVLSKKNNNNHNTSNHLPACQKEWRVQDDEPTKVEKNTTAIAKCERNELELEVSFITRSYEGT